MSNAEHVLCSASGREVPAQTFPVQLGNYDHLHLRIPSLTFHLHLPTGPHRLISASLPNSSISSVNICTIFSTHVLHLRQSDGLKVLRLTLQRPGAAACTPAQTAYVLIAAHSTAQVVCPVASHAHVQWQYPVSGVTKVYTQRRPLTRA